MKDILDVVKSFKHSGLLLEGVGEAKDQKEGFLSMQLGTLGASLLGNMFRQRSYKSRRRNC